MVEITIGLGIAFSLILSETLGVTAGGVIVPGYIALYLHQPDQILMTFSCGSYRHWYSKIFEQLHVHLRQASFSPDFAVGIYSRLYIAKSDFFTDRYIFLCGDWKYNSRTYRQLDGQTGSPPNAICYIDNCCFSKAFGYVIVGRSVGCLINSILNHLFRSFKKHLYW
jgi:hypothetical protein